MAGGKAAAAAVLMIVLSACATAVEEQATSDGLECDTDERIASSSSWDGTGPTTFDSPEEAVRDRLGLDEDAVLRVRDLPGADDSVEAEVLVQSDDRWQTLVGVRQDEDGWYADGVTQCA